MGKLEVGEEAGSCTLWSSSFRTISSTDGIMVLKNSRAVRSEILIKHDPAAIPDTSSVSMQFHSSPIHCHELIFFSFHSRSLPIVVMFHNRSILVVYLEAAQALDFFLPTPSPEPQLR